MTIGDAAIGLAIVYFAYRQNEIFQKQNDIFAAQSGTTNMAVEKKSSTWVRRYWPTLVLILLVLLGWAPIGYKYVSKYLGGTPAAANSVETDSRLAPWLLGAGLVAMIALDLRKRFSPQSKNVGRAALPEIQAGNLELLKNAPAIRIDYKGGVPGKLILENDRDSPAIIRRIGKLLSREEYESENALTLIPDVPFQVAKGHPVECKLYGVVSPGATSSSLEGVLQGANEGSTDSILVDYDDGDGHDFSRLFLLTRKTDGSIVFVPDPVALRGQTKPPKAGVQNLFDLRRRLALARYLETRRPEQAPTIPRYQLPVFTIQEIKADPPATNPSIVYKDKIRLVLTNATSKEIEVWTPIWESSEVEAQGTPLGSRFRLEGPLGWRRNDWTKDESGREKEFSSLQLKPGVTVDCYVGLLAPHGKSLSERLRTHASIGIAVFPVKIEDKLYVEPVEC